MAENIVKEHFFYSPPVENGGTPPEGISKPPEGAIAMSLEGSPYYKPMGVRKITDDLEKLALIREVAKIKAESKDVDGKLNSINLAQKLKTELGGEAPKTEQVDLYLSREKSVLSEIARQSAIGIEQALQHHKWMGKENDNFRLASWQASHHEQVLDADVEHVDISLVAKDWWLNKETSAILSRLHIDTKYMRSTFQFFEHFNPFAFEYHDGMRVLRVLKLDQRFCPDAHDFITTFQKDEKSFNLNEEQKQFLPEGMKEGIREKGIEFDDLSQDLMFSVASAGQVIWEDEEIIKRSQMVLPKEQQKKFLSSVDVGRFSKAQLNFIYKVFGVYPNEKEGSVDGISLRDIYIDPKSEKKKSYKMLNEIRDDWDVKVPKHILNWFSMETTPENQDAYTAKMMACLLLDSWKKVLNLDPDFDFEGTIAGTKREGGAFEEQQQSMEEIIKDTNDLAKEILDVWFIPNKTDYFSERFNHLKQVDLDLASMIVQKNRQEAWAFLYAGRLASELKYEWKEDRIHPENSKWVRKQDIGSLHAASDMGDMYHFLRRKMKYQEASRSQGSFFLPDSAEMRTEWLNEHRADWKPSIDPYLDSESEKYDPFLAKWWTLLEDTDEGKAFRKELGLSWKVDPLLSKYIKNIAIAWETPYIHQKSSVEGKDNKRIVIPLFLQYPFVEFNYWDTITLDDQENNEGGEIRSVFYRMTKERKPKSSFNYHRMLSNNVDFHNVTMDQLSNIMTVFYDTPEARDLDQVFFDSVGKLRTIIKRADLGFRSNGFYMAEVPLKDSNGKIVGHGRERVPVTLYEMGIVPMLVSHHLAKRYNLIGVGGFNPTNLNEFLVDVSEWITMTTYINKDKKEAKAYKDTMCLLTFFYTMLLSRMSTVSAEQDNPDMKNKHEKLYEEVKKINPNLGKINKPEIRIKQTPTVGKG